MSLKEVTWMISMGRDSIVFPCPGDSESLLKIYDNLALSDVLEYNEMHRKYWSKGTIQVTPDKKYLDYARMKGWEISFLWAEIRGIVIGVLDLSTSEVTENNDWYTFAKIPLIKWTNLANHLEATQDEKTEYALRMIEDMANVWLESLWVPVERRKKPIKNLNKWHIIGRENLMVSGINDDWYVEIVVTDIGYDIRKALDFERKLDWQKLH